MDTIIQKLEEKDSIIMKFALKNNSQSQHKEYYSTQLLSKE